MGVGVRRQKRVLVGLSKCPRMGLHQMGMTLPVRVTLQKFVLISVVFYYGLSFSFIE